MAGGDRVVSRQAHRGNISLPGQIERGAVQSRQGGQETDPRITGEFLLTLGFVSEEDLARAVAEAGGLEYVSLTEDLVDPATIPLLGEKALGKYAALDVSWSAMATSSYLTW